jgi:hypothetical protein
MAQAATFDQNESGFSAILAGVSVKGITDHGYEGTLSVNPTNSVLSGKNGM